MPRMKRDDAIALIKHLFGQQVQPSGSRTSPIHAYGALSDFVVRTSCLPLSAVATWEQPGLFVANDDLQYCTRPNLTVIYVMSCGTIVAMIIPKLPLKRLPSHLNILAKNGVFDGEVGFKIAEEHWYTIGDYNNLIHRRGQKKVAHVARKSVVK
jgi:hypothetical protein